MVDTSTVLSGIKLDNPVIPASGTFGFGTEFNDYYDINLKESMGYTYDTIGIIILYYLFFINFCKYEQSKFVSITDFPSAYL